MKLTTATVRGSFYYVEEEGKAVLMQQMKIMMTGKMKGKSWKCVSFNKIDRFMVKCSCWENGGFFRLPGFWRRFFLKERHEWFYFVDALLRFLEPGSGYICFS